MSTFVEVTLGAAALGLVDQLVDTGLYGGTRRDAIERLVTESLERKAADGLVRIPPAYTAYNRPPERDP